MGAPWLMTRDSSRGSARKRGVRARRGFTLLESAFATVIIGVGVLALIEAQSNFTRSNEFSTGSATATYLANELRERLRSLPKFDPVNGLFITGSGGGATLNGWGKQAWMTTVADFNNVSAYDGAVFGTGGMPGPIDATGNVVSAVGPDGVVQTANGVNVPLSGYIQSVTVTKVDPFNYNTTRAPNYTRAASGSLPALAVDKFPVRVSVSVTYQGPLDATRTEQARVSWIVP